MNKKKIFKSIERGFAIFGLAVILYSLFIFPDIINGIEYDKPNTELDTTYFQTLNLFNSCDGIEYFENMTLEEAELTIDLMMLTRYKVRPGAITVQQFLDGEKGDCETKAFVLGCLYEMKEIPHHFQYTGHVEAIKK